MGLLCLSKILRQKGLQTINFIGFFDKFVFPRLFQNGKPQTEKACNFLAKMMDLLDQKKFRGQKAEDMKKYLELSIQACGKYTNVFPESELLHNGHLSCTYMKKLVKRDTQSVLPALLQYVRFVIGSPSIQNKKSYVDKDFSNVLFPLFDNLPVQAKMWRERLRPKLRNLGQSGEILYSVLEEPITELLQPTCHPEREVVSSPSSPESLSPQSPKPTSPPIHRRLPAPHYRVPSYNPNKWFDEQLRKSTHKRKARKPLRLERVVRTPIRVGDVKVLSSENRGSAGDSSDPNGWDDIEIDLSPSPVQASSFFQNLPDSPKLPPSSVSSPKHSSHQPIRQFNQKRQRIQTFVDSPLIEPKLRPHAPKPTPMSSHRGIKPRKEFEATRKQFLADYMDMFTASHVPMNQGRNQRQKELRETRARFLKQSMHKWTEQQPELPGATAPTLPSPTPRYPKLESKVTYPPRLNDQDDTLKFNSMFSPNDHLTSLRKWVHIHSKTPIEKMKSLFVRDWLKDAVNWEGGRGCKDIIRELANRVDRKDTVLYDLIIFARKMCYSRYVMKVMNDLAKYPKLEEFLFDSLLCRDADIFEVWNTIYTMRNGNERTVAIEGWKIFVYFGLLNSKKSCDALSQKLKYVGMKANFLNDQGVFKKQEGKLKTLAIHLRELLELCEKATKEDTRRSLKDELDILGASVAKGIGKYCSRRNIHKPQVIHKPKTLQRSRSI